MTTNHLGQPIGEPVPDWTPAIRPSRSPLNQPAMQGRPTRLEPLAPTRHSRDLFEAFSLDREGRNWTYLPIGPFTTFDAFQAWIERDCLEDDPFFYAVIDPATGKALGMASHMRVQPEAGVIEVGHIHYSPKLQRSIAATETMALMMRRAFNQLGYRRYEWKCNALNEPSMRAAIRLGFSYEGTFRQAGVVKGHNRDTAWYAIIDKHWPKIEQAFDTWLDPGNFDPDGQQRRSLDAFREAL